MENDNKPQNEEAEECECVCECVRGDLVTITLRINPNVLMAIFFVTLGAIAFFLQ
jgi:hypothetical protein